MDVFIFTFRVDSSSCRVRRLRRKWRSRNDAGLRIRSLSKECSDWRSASPEEGLGGEEAAIACDQGSAGSVSSNGRRCASSGVGQARRVGRRGIADRCRHPRRLGSVTAGGRK